jgi:hypothetical protein
MAWGPRYRASGRTQQKTPPPTILYFWHGRLPSDRPDITDVFTGRYQANAFLFSRSLHSNGTTGYNSIYIPTHTHTHICIYITVKYRNQGVMTLALTNNVMQSNAYPVAVERAREEYTVLAQLNNTARVSSSCGRHFPLRATVYIVLIFIESILSFGMPCSLVDVQQGFGGKCYFQLHGEKKGERENVSTDIGTAVTIFICIPNVPQSNYTSTLKTSHHRPPIRSYIASHGLHSYSCEYLTWPLSNAMLNSASREAERRLGVRDLRLKPQKWGGRGVSQTPDPSNANKLH